MANFKELAKDTVIYGASSIIGRFLNYLLVPLYTYRITAASGGYGVITNMYAYTALLLVLLTYGMETTMFRFANKQGGNPDKVFATVARMVACTSAVFVALVCVFLGPVSSAMGYPDNPSYIWTMAVVVALDAFQAILFSYLRYQKRAIRFAALKLLFIGLNILLNLTFFVLLPDLYARSPELAGHIYNPGIGVGYVFYINLFCTAFVGLFFWKEMRKAFFWKAPEGEKTFDGAFIRELLSYSWPILVFGIAGILNQTADKILFPHIYRQPDAAAQLGIYGAASKIAMIMAMITQAFRYAYEPFVFGNSKEADSRETNAKGMKYFVIFTLLAFLCVIAYMDILRYVIQKDYWDGLRVVPIVMAAEMMMGIVFNLSFWYKLTDKTIWGAVFSGAGCAVLIVVNVLFVPRFGYMACAWGGFAGYATAMLLSYFVGQKKYPIAYPLRQMGAYLALAMLLFAGMTASNRYLGIVPAVALNTVLVVVFAVYIVKKDLPLSAIPVIGRYFRKK